MKKFTKSFIKFLLIFALAASPAFSATISQEEFDRLRLTDKLLKSQIGEMETEFESSPSLKKYRVEYLATVSTKKPLPVTATNMSKLISSTKYVFLGDEHTTAESQKNTVSILTMMLSAKKPVTLVIEWIDESFQKEVNLFLAGKLPLKSLKTKISFTKYWGFSWANYSKVLSAAKKLKVPVLLVERLKKSHNLAERDTHIAKAIASNAMQNKSMRYLVVYGEYHLLGPDHLTDKCKKLGLKNQIILVGDAVDVYWKLLAKSRDPKKVGFAKLKSNVYYIRSGTPLERSYSYRSYLMKILGWSNDDFEDDIRASDIVPASANARDFDSLHNPAANRR